MVCMDGFILTHAYERVDMPGQEQVDAFLPPFEPRQVLDPAEPVTIGAMVGPEAFTEVKYLAHAKQMQALDLIPEIAAEFAARFGRDSGGLRARLPHRGRGDDRGRARLGARHDRGRRSTSCASEGVKIGARRRSSRFRPFPLDEVRAALGHAQRVVVLEKALAVGIGGIVSAERADGARRASSSHGYTVIAGLGGRPITKASLHAAVRRRARRTSSQPLDVPRHGLGARRARAARGRADAPLGPHAENILRDIGAVAARPH